MRHEEAYRACVNAVLEHEAQHDITLSTLEMHDIQRYVGIAVDEYQHVVGEHVRGDLHHMINPVIGQLRQLANNYEDTDARFAQGLQGFAGRLSAALDAMDASLGFEEYTDEVEEKRRQFGMGLP